MGLFDPIDWDGNGKIDSADRFIDFMVYNEICGEESRQENDILFDDKDSDDPFDISFDEDDDF